MMCLYRNIKWPAEASWQMRPTARNLVPGRTRSAEEAAGVMAVAVI